VADFLAYDIEQIASMTPLYAMNDEIDTARRVRGAGGGESVTLAVNGFFAGAGSVYVLTGAAWITAAVAGFAVVLAAILGRGSGRRY
jgi:hypothetical protein